MSWRHRFPDSSDFESEEEYDEAVEAYYDAADNHKKYYKHINCDKDGSIIRSTEEEYYEYMEGIE